MAGGYTSASIAQPSDFSPFGNYTDPSSQPGQYPLSLGSVVFAATECPDKLTFGNDTAHHVDDVIGGGRDVLTFGLRAKPVSWTGRIWGPNVTARKQALRQMQLAQSEVLITFRDERYYCVITSFEATSLSVDAEYAISIVITRDANGSATVTQPLSIDTQVSSLATQATQNAGAVAAVDPVGGGALQAQTANVQSAIDGAGPLSQLVGPNLTSFLNTVNTATAAAKSYVGALSPAASQFLAATQVATSLALIARNVQQGQSNQTVTAFGDSLADLAALHLGSPDFWPLIGQANGIIGLRCPPGVPTPIVIPPIPVVTS